MDRKLACDRSKFMEIDADSRYFNQIGKLMKASFPWSDLKHQTLIPKLIRHHGYRCFVSLEGETVVGVIVVIGMVEGDYRNAEGIVTIAYISVLDECRRFGIGKAMLLNVEAIASSMGFSKMMLNSLVDKIGFYKSVGYDMVYQDDPIEEIDPKSPRYYLHTYMMSKTLKK